MRSLDGRSVGNEKEVRSESSKLGMDHIRIFMPIVDANPHLNPRELFPRQDDGETYLSKGAEPGQNASPNPSAVLAFWWRENFDSRFFDG